MAQLPKITIVTPSYNQGKFIERTLKSVLSQDYPRLEYIVMDGGSTDETVSILRKYEKQYGKGGTKEKKGVSFSWVSEKDNGQTHAINKGMKKATGDIFAYLNSDDVYPAGTLRQVGTYFAQHPKDSFIYGHGRLIDSDDNQIGFYNDYQVDREKLWEACAISQPTTFWRAQVYKKIGPFDESYRFTMDYDYWMRVSKKHHMMYIPTIIANSRIHQEAKTSAFTHKLHGEALQACMKHYGKVHYDWIFTYTDSEIDNTIKDRKYYCHMVVKSLWYYFQYNKSLPPPKGIKIILSWAAKLLP